MPPRPDNEPPAPRKIVRRSKNAEWVRIEEYPGLAAERIRGVDIYRTKEPAPLRYRVVISVFLNRHYRIPAVVAIKNERLIRFGSAPVEFGILPPGERKVTEWRAELPDYRDRDVILSNPDYVEMTSDEFG